MSIAPSDKDPKHFDSMLYVRGSGFSYLMVIHVKTESNILKRYFFALPWSSISNAMIEVELQKK